METTICIQGSPIPTERFLGDLVEAIKAAGPYQKLKNHKGDPMEKEVTKKEAELIAVTRAFIKMVKEELPDLTHDQVANFTLQKIGRLSL